VLWITHTLAWGSSYYLPAIPGEPTANALGLSRIMVFGCSPELRLELP